MAHSEGESCWWRRLYPIRVPPGWEFVFNKLETLEPEEVQEDDRIWLFHFTEDILYIRSMRRHRVNKKTEEQIISIDLGWYPDGDPKGSYTLTAILDKNWEEPLLEYRSRSTHEIVDIMELWMFRYFSYGFIDEKSFRRNHPDRN